MKFTAASKADFYRRLKAAAPKVEHHLREANRKTASGIVSMAQRLVEVDDGTLRDSIRMAPGTKNETAFIVRAGGPTTTKPVQDGADASYDYALALEFGTVRQPAEPFFYPSVRVEKRTHKGRVSRALKKGIQEAGFG